MCGIAGWIDLRRDLSAQARVLDAMTDTQQCRGPDARGVWLSRDAAIGHRRLAVVDLEGGTQPMTARTPAGDDVVLSYSGEVYNFAELREQLAAAGHRFATRSDTEVVLRSYLQWGQDCVQRFVGMFAFAVWDSGRRSLLLARDRLGVKPLYYHAYDGGVVFGSEPKALLASPVLDPVLDETGVLDLFAMFGTDTPGRTPLRGVREVAPGETVTLDERGLRRRRYWSLDSHEHPDGYARSVATVRDLLAESVTDRLVADVPLCSLVSGGVDSSAVSALAAEGLARRDGGKLHTFSVDIAGSADDFTADENRPDRDAPYVHALADHIGSAHTDIVVDTGDLAEVTHRATAARDLPSLGDLDASLYLLFRGIAGRSTVALSGESADEVFGGYHWFHDPEAVERAGFPWNRDNLGFARVLRGDLRERLRPERYVADRYAEALAEVPRLPGEAPAAARRRELNYLALTRFLPVLLDRKDRMSMATGLEVRVPFCDHRLVEYAWNLPWETRCPDGRPKGILRDAVTDLMPQALSGRPKSMYPAVATPDYDREVRARARELVAGRSGVGELLDPARVRALADGSSPRPPWMQRMALTYLVEIDHWMRSYGVRLA